MSKGLCYESKDAKYQAIIQLFLIFGRIMNLFITKLLIQEFYCKWRFHACSKWVPDVFSHGRIIPLEFWFLSASFSRWFEKSRYFDFSAAVVWSFPQEDTADSWRKCLQNMKLLMMNYTHIYKDPPYSCQDVFKVVCCRFVVCGKGLIWLFYF